MKGTSDFPLGLYLISCLFWTPSIDRGQSVQEHEEQICWTVIRGYEVGLITILAVPAASIDIEQWRVQLDDTGKSRIAIWALFWCLACSELPAPTEGKVCRNTRNRSAKSHTGGRSSSQVCWMWNGTGLRSGCYIHLRLLKICSFTLKLRNEWNLVQAL